MRSPTVNDQPRGGKEVAIATPQKFVRLGATARSARGKEFVCLSLLTLALLLPFVDKPLHVDDPVYVWTAQHIVAHPLDFYGLSVNWFKTTESIAALQQNPPGVSYWLAIVGALFGWSEPAMHCGMLVPPVFAVIGVWLLARRLGAPPTPASMTLLAMPGFLVSSTTLMADVLATAFWTWAVLAWVVGLQERKFGWLAAGALLVSLCILTKYVGLGLIPLLFTYTLAKYRRFELGGSLLLLVPLAITLVYRARMISRYGVDPFAAASSYSQHERPWASTTIELPWTGLIFLGGTFLPALLLSTWIFGKWFSAFSIVFILLVVAALLGMQTLAHCPLRTSEGPRWGLVTQLALFTLSGALVFASIIKHMVQRPSAEAILLGLWVCGLFAFASVVNWSTNTRALLPAAPAVAILLAAEVRVPRARVFGLSPGPLAMLGIGLLVGLFVAQADQALAQSKRNAAIEIARGRLRGGHPLWYQGSWGFQYYMDLEGARKVDWNHVEVSPGDEMVEGYSTGVDIQLLPPVAVRPVAHYQVAVRALASTMSTEAGAGFYSDRFGPAPYVFGFPPDEVYFILAFQTRVVVKNGFLYPDLHPGTEAPH